MSDIYRHSVQRPPQYHPLPGYRVRSSRRPRARAHGAFRATGMATLALVFIGIALLAVLSLRCAAEDASQRPPAEQERTP